MRTSISEEEGDEMLHLLLASSIASAVAHPVLTAKVVAGGTGVVVSKATAKVVSAVVHNAAKETSGGISGVLSTYAKR